MATSRAQSATARLQGSTQTGVQNGPTRTQHRVGLPVKRGMRRTGDYPADSYMSTKYDSDFRGATAEEIQICMGKARPKSPTRSNKPHPSQAFIRWAGHNKSILDDSNTEVQAKEKDVEREEQWYSNDFRELGGKPVVHSDATRVMGTFQRLDLPYEAADSTKYGHFTHTAPAESSTKEQPHRLLSRSGRAREGVPVTRRSLQRSIRDPDTLPALEEWLTKDANPDEQHAVLSMMTAAEHSVLSKAARQHLQPKAVPAVQQWMSQAPPHEREVAADLFATLPSGREPITSVAKTSRHGAKLRRSQSDTSSRAYGTTRDAPAMHTRRCSHADINAPMQWHLKSDRDPRPQVVHRGSIYQAPHRYRGNDYAIHPEWPTYLD